MLLLVLAVGAVVRVVEVVVVGAVVGAVLGAVLVALLVLVLLADILKTRVVLLASVAGRGQLSADWRKKGTRKEFRNLAEFIVGGLTTITLAVTG